MQNRRKFIRNSLLTVSGAGLISGSFPQSQAINESTDKESKFIYRTLGRTGIRLPVISMGTAYNNNPNLVRQALDKGVRLFATAEAYTNKRMAGSKLIRIQRSFWITHMEALNECR